MVDYYGSHPLNSIRLARHLFPEIEYDKDEFLIWPPNLFAYTSQILSLTGAYHLAVSPPNIDGNLTSEEDNQILNGIWPPNISIMKDWVEKMAKEWYRQNSLAEEPNLEILKSVAKWDELVRKISNKWRENLTSFSPKIFSKIKAQESSDRKQVIVAEIVKRVPHELIGFWQVFASGSSDGDGSDIMELLCTGSNSSLEKWRALQSLLSIHAIVDETCVGWGIWNVGEKSSPSKVSRSADEEWKPGMFSEAQRFAHEELLEKHGTLATIHNDRGRVLPKRHTPSVGITLRSLSSNLGFHRSSVDVNWRRSTDCPLSEKIERHKAFTVLLLPWPIEVRTRDFQQEEKHPVVVNNDRYGFFSYAPSTYEGGHEEGLKDKLRKVLREAKKEAGKVDMVILPESSLNSDSLKFLEEILKHSEFEVSCYVAGVRDEPLGARFQRNAVYCKLLNKTTDRRSKNLYEFPQDPPEIDEDKSRYKQYKHHRWKLTRPQIIQYGLGHVLKPNVNWWEAIRIGRRKVSFVNVGNRLTICPLICEDLARQDPIADLIRTVGPSLVITILMDGPQKSDRWSSRYASVLSDDPGSSVITLTSFGMVHRWNQTSKDPSRVISLWNDGQGPPREISLEEDADAVLLSLCIESRKEEIADGRLEYAETSVITFGGIHQIKLEKKT